MNSSIAYIIVGIVSGFFLGLIGMGSGLITVPGLTLSGMTVNQAITTSLLLQAVPLTIPGFLVFERKGHFDWEGSMYTLVGSFVGLLIGASLSYYSVISDKNLYILLSIVLVLSGAVVFYRHVLDPKLEKEIKKEPQPKLKS
jgi:uncharacterized membrane protein YfcA